MIRGITIILSSIIFLYAGAPLGQTLEEQKFEKDFQSAIRMMESGNNQAAIQLFDQVIQKDPQRREAYYQRAIAKWRIDDEAGAMNDLDRTIELNPDHAEAVWDRANLKTRRKDFEGAIDDYGRYINLIKNTTKSAVLYDAYNKRAAAKLKMGDRQGGIDDYKTSTRLAPNNHAAFYQLGRLEFDRGQYESALHYFDKTLDANKGLTIARFYRGIARYHLEDYLGALQDLKDCENELGSQEEAAIHYYEGMARIKNNYIPDGCENLKKALELGFKDAAAAIDTYCK